MCLTACSDELRFIAQPALPPTETVILIPRGGRALYAALPSAPIEVPVADEEPELLLLAYGASSESLGLTLGALEQAATCRDCALLTPTSVFLREAEGEWKDLAGVVPDWGRQALVGDHLTRCGGCPGFQSDLVVLPGLEDSTSFRLAPWDESSVWAADVSTDRIFRVFASGEFQPACVAERPLGTEAVFRGPGSELWLIDGAGVVQLMDLSALDPSLPCHAATSTRTSPLGAVASALLVVPNEPGPSVYALVAPSRRVGEDAELHRFHDGAWTALYTFGQSGGVASLARDRDGVVHAVVGTAELVRATGDQVSVWRGHDPRVAFELTAVAEVPWLGLVTASRLRGLVLPSGADGWVALEAPNLVTSLGAERIGSIQLHGEGLLMANYQGGLHYYSEQTGYCEQQPIFGRESGRYLTRLPDGTLFSAESRLYRAWPRPDVCAR